MPLDRLVNSNFLHCSNTSGASGPEDIELGEGAVRWSQLWMDDVHEGHGETARLDVEDIEEDQSERVEKLDTERPLD